MRSPSLLDSLAINLATVRQQWNLREAVEGCARHGVTAIDPWRDQVAVLGLPESARLIKATGMSVARLALRSAAFCFFASSARAAAFRMLGGGDRGRERIHCLRSPQRHALRGPR